MLFPPDQAPPHPPPRVVVTGAGIVTALGVGWRQNSEGFRAGRTAFREVSLFDTSGQRVRTAAEVTLPAALPSTRLSTREATRLERSGTLLLHAAHEAWSQAGWAPSENLPLILGTTAGGMSLGEDYLRTALREPHRQRSQPTRAIHYQAQTQGRTMANAFGFEGPIWIISNACAAGANAIGQAWELIRSGRADRVLTGGYDPLSQMVFVGFNVLQALSPTRCRPFDAQRDGLALGEGAAALALETLDSARRRGATILAEIIGYGTTIDAFHLTQPQPQGDAAFTSMSLACESARVRPEDIGYINAHGTGTPLNDSAEAAAITRWAGPRAATLPVSSTKASIGHLLGGAGAVEAIVCLMALQGQWLPPETTIETPDTACGFPIVRQPQDARLDVVLSNSFGFGGVNASLVLRRWA